MRNLFAIIIIFVMIISLSSCQNIFNRSEPDTSPEIPWSEAEVDPNITAPPVDDVPDTNNSVLPDDTLPELTQEDLGISSSSLPEQEVDELEFDFGTPVIVDSDVNTEFSGLELEGGLPLEIGTGSPSPISTMEPVAPTIEPTNIPVEIDEGAVEILAEEELDNPGEDLAKTSDSISILWMAIAVLFLLLLLKLYIGRREVEV